MVPKKNGKAACDLYCKVHLSFHVKSILHKRLLFNFFPVQVNTKNEPKMKGVSFKTNSGRSVTKDGRWHFLLATMGLTTCYFHRKHTKKKNSKTSKLIQFFAYLSHIPPQFLNLVTTLLWCCISVGVKQKTAKNHQEVSFFNFTTLN